MIIGALFSIFMWVVGVLASFDIIARLNGDLPICLSNDPDPLRMKGGVSTLTGTLIVLAVVGLVAAICLL